MKFIKHIPNTLTCLNLLSGMVGIYFVLKGNLPYGAYFIFISAIFDFLDGYAARLFQLHSEIGKQLDSLADLVSFGILPAFILFEWIRQVSDNPYLPFAGLIVGIFSAIRLAKFNTDVRQTDRFIGVPTPANALLISTLPFMATRFPILGHWISTPGALITIAFTMSYLLVAELPLIALKFKDYTFKANIFRYMILAAGLICIIFIGLGGIPIVIISYIVISVLEGVIIKNEDKGVDT